MDADPVVLMPCMPKRMSQRERFIVQRQQGAAVKPTGQCRKRLEPSFGPGASCSKALERYKM